ncbi:hypothetical protein CDAR_188011 [Caerostris darwini]|uniref:Uncharacterized protein n=1 Tax=Caerostris darwini TaxID=1538125 RepID=A0AAV4SNL6_9ARAC|nr:hypothetical protein CDAR_188011 [Caerostris darwini]
MKTLSSAEKPTLKVSTLEHVLPVAPDPSRNQPSRRTATEKKKKENRGSFPLIRPRERKENKHPPPIDWLLEVFFPARQPTHGDSRSMRENKARARITQPCRTA